MYRLSEVIWVDLPMPSFLGRQLTWAWVHEVFIKSPGSLAFWVHDWHLHKDVTLAQIMPVAGKLCKSHKILGAQGNYRSLLFWDIPPAQGWTVTNIWLQAMLEPRECFRCMCVFSQNYKAQQLLVPEAAESFCVFRLFISDYIPP